MTPDQIIAAAKVMQQIKLLPQKIWASQVKEGKTQVYPFFDEMVDATGGYGCYSLYVYMGPTCPGIEIVSSET